jgi:hypothetical protein
MLTCGSPAVPGLAVDDHGAGGSVVEASAVAVVDDCGEHQTDQEGADRAAQQAYLG